MVATKKLWLTLKVLRLTEWYWSTVYHNSASVSVPVPVYPVQSPVNYDSIKDVSKIVFYLLIGSKLIIIWVSETNQHVCQGACFIKVYL